ncbi:TRAP transporter substrate-binding protein [Aliirhizobium smilacinae]|uniref:TRAP transporter substrate-binding protein n=1 Tax=Aliirhizobium smilacinae TaxID=1395944 RepID=A0A5C4XCT2_9HYPH|nr:TRAP transporter substrate-binding protein [Rhizobium smilacinae]TNM61247.1 TRAP transporter substrate-binding protein [Rhizobium smilacinae]
MKRTFKAIRTMLLAAGAAGVLLASPAMSRDFRSADIHPNDYPTVQGAMYMGKILSERTNGRLGVKVFPNGALGDERGTIEQLRIGGLDMLRISAAVVNNMVPETIVISMPFIFRSTAHERTVLDGPIGEEVLKALEKQGMIGLAFYDSGARSMYTKKPIKTLADLHNMKIRVQQSDMFVAMVQALGANATPMPMGEVYTGLKTGIIDAAENNYPSFESSHHYEAAKYYTRTEHAMVPELLLFSKPIWDKLPAEDQALIRQAAKDSVVEQRRLWDARETTSKEIVEKAGAVIEDVNDKQEFIDAMKPVYEQFAKTPELQDLVKRIQATK